MREDPEALGLLTDLYELAMADAYLSEGLLDDAAFSLFVRRLPAHRHFLLATGLSDALACLEQYRFSHRSLDYLESLHLLSDRLLSYLEHFRFRGEVRAVAEGTPLFAQEPLLEVVAPLPEAQLVESVIINQMQLQTVAASTAARMVIAARGRQLVDFGLRRAHGTDAAVKVARAAYVAGFSATSNALAAARYGIPLVGTMAHSYVQAHKDELQAFRAFLRVFPRATLLVDTYDTLQGVRQVVQLARELGPLFQAPAVRLDSGDLFRLSVESRCILDEAGLSRVGLFASGGLNETSIAALVEEAAPFQGFGVGSALAVSEDAPCLDIAYKLVAFGNEPRMKLSAGKVTYPWPKQVFRQERRGEAVQDVLAIWGEDLPGQPLLETVMKSGERTEAGRRSIQVARARAHEEVSRLPARVRSLAGGAYPVQVSEQLSSQTQALAAKLATRV